MELYGSNIKTNSFRETETPKKFPYILEDGTFLCFRKRKP